MPTTQEAARSIRRSFYSAQLEPAHTRASLITGRRPNVWTPPEPAMRSELRLPCLGAASCMRSWEKAAGPHSR
jgi:hypothetical protein